MTTKILLASVFLSALVVSNAEEDEHIPSGSGEFWVFIGICLGLVLLGGLMSGLTVGLFSIDPVKLSLLQLDKKSDPKQRERAIKVEPVLRQHHLLLVTLLVANAAAMEALPIFLDRLVPSYIAIILSVTFVLIFGEIIPQAVCTKNPLKIGAMMVPVVKCFMLLLYPISYPISKLLDYILGAESHTVLFKRSELSALIEMHSSGKGGSLIHDEVTILKGAIRMKERTAADAMTPMREMFMLPIDACLDEDNMGDIMAKGYSRIPVYKGSKHNIQGVALVKRLIMVSPTESRCIGDFAVRMPIVIPPEMPLFDVLNRFQEGKSHLALVTDYADEVRQHMRDGSDVPPHVRIKGCITLEDVIEELIQEEIIDENDRDEYIGALKTRKRARKTVTKWRQMIAARKAARMKQARSQSTGFPVVPSGSVQRTKGSGSDYALLVDEDEKA